MKRPKPTVVEHSVWPPPKADPKHKTRACTAIHLPKGTRLIEVIACEGSKRNVHGGIHATMSLPSGLRIDTLLVYHEAGVRETQPETVIDEVITALEEWAKVAGPASKGDQEAIPKVTAADAKLLALVERLSQ